MPAGGRRKESTMVSVDLKSLVTRLNRFSTRALEAAAGLCVSRTNYEVTVEHLLYQILEASSSDLHEILRHFELEPAHVRRALLSAIEAFRTGNAGRPVRTSILLKHNASPAVINTAASKSGWSKRNFQNNLAQPYC